MNPAEFFYETFVEECAEFKVTDLFWKRGGPKNFGKITLLPLCAVSRLFEANDIIAFTFLYENLSQ